MQLTRVKNLDKWSSRLLHLSPGIRVKVKLDKHQQSFEPTYTTTREQELWINSPLVAGDMNVWQCAFQLSCRDPAAGDVTQQVEAELPLDRGQGWRQVGKHGDRQERKRRLRFKKKTAQHWGAGSLIFFQYFIWENNGMKERTGMNNDRLPRSLLTMVIISQPDSTGSRLIRDTSVLFIIYLEPSSRHPPICIESNSFKAPS